MRIAVTGGSGSLGRALLTRLTTSGADRIVTFSRDEQKKAALLADFGQHPGFRVYAGDVRDPGRLADIFHGCEVVVHGAARKVVTADPDEPREMLLTNVLGTTNVVNAARQAGVRKLLFISSDKAVHPCNAYGYSKAMAEQLVIMENARSYPQGLRLAVLRYGNVIGSNGSVLRVWRHCLAEGRPLPISDSRMTRFWITLPQAVDAVLAAVADLRGGEVFIPHIPASTIITLALACTAGDERPHGRPNFTEIGIRPGGEKLYEELLSSAEIRRARRLGMFYVVPPDVVADQRWDAAVWRGEPVEPDFTYRSDTWPHRVDVDPMRALLESA